MKGWSRTTIGEELSVENLAKFVVFTLWRRDEKDTLNLLTSGCVVRILSH
jgi:hypothetical protein